LDLLLTALGFLSVPAGYRLYVCIGMKATVSSNNSIAYSRMAHNTSFVDYHGLKCLVNWVLMAMFILCLERTFFIEALRSASKRLSVDWSVYGKGLFHELPVV